MFKLGIASVKDLKNGSGLTLFRKKKNISITLYDQIQTEPEFDILAERILNSFADSRSTYKRTYVNRFSNFDKMAYDCILKSFEKSKNLIIQDTGVSDGRTSVDFFNILNREFECILFEASDYNPYVNVLEYRNFKIVLSPEDDTSKNKIVEISFAPPPFVFNIMYPDRLIYYPINRLIVFVLMHTIVPKILKMHEKNKISSKKIMLFCPSALKLMENDNRFKLIEHNILKPFIKKSHIVRAMNILNLSYFSNKEFITIIRNFHDGLLENGLLITGSNQDAGSIVNGGIYKKTNAGFEIIKKSGEGSPVNDLILSSHKEK
jgi:hypothetical protein